MDRRSSDLRLRRGVKGARKFALCAALLGAWAAPALVWAGSELRAPTGTGRAAATLHREQHRVAGLVTGVADGDTCYVMIDGKSTRVRLAQIDAPEKTQAFGRRAEQSLRDLVAKQDVVVTWSETDRYGRPVVRIVAKGVDVNAEQVRRGMAWVYRQYSNDPALVGLENTARLERRGLWADPHAIEPWVWRQRHRSATFKDVHRVDLRTELAGAGLRSER